MEAHPTGAGLPLGSGAVAAQTGQLLPRLAAVTRPEQRRVFDPGVHGVRIGERRLEVPDALELPGMLRAVVELVRGEWLAGIRRRVVHEFVALAGRHALRRLGHPAARRLPRLAAVAGPLDDLAEPPAGLRRVQTVRIGGGSLHVVDLPPCEVRAADIPALALAVRCQNEGSLSRADQYSYSAHDPLLSLWPRHGARKHNSRISHSPSQPGQCCWCRRMKVRAAASASSRDSAASTA